MGFEGMEGGGGGLTVWEGGFEGMGGGGVGSMMFYNACVL